MPTHMYADMCTLFSAPLHQDQLDNMNCGLACNMLPELAQASKGRVVDEPAQNREAVK